MPVARLFLLIGFLGAPRSDQLPAESPAIPKFDLADAASHPLTRVIDGDTLLVEIDGKHRKVRLLGVRAAPPHIAHGKAARTFLEHLLDAESVFIVADSREPVEDRFGSLNAYVLRAPDGLFVNLEAVRQGYAEVVANLHFEHREVFSYYEGRAKTAGKGMWSRPAKLTRPEAVNPPEEAAPDAPKNEDAREGQAEPATGSMVYVTPSGKKFHREKCIHVRGRGRTVPIEQARQQGLTPCSQCKPIP